jgi:hypothetical protein
MFALVVQRIQRLAQHPLSTIVQAFYYPAQDYFRQERPRKIPARIVNIARHGKAHEFSSLGVFIT